MEVHYSSKDTEWFTPKPLFNRLNKIHKFTLDPCATKESALCKKYHTKEHDGLKQSWVNERVFMNPPYGREIKHWVKKAYDETTTAFAEDSAQLVVGLLPARTDTKWFHDYIYRCADTEFLRGRIKFWSLNWLGELTEGDPCPFPSMVVIWR